MFKSNKIFLPMSIFPFSLRSPFYKKGELCAYKNAKECPHDYYNACGLDLRNCNHSKDTLKSNIIKKKTKGIRSRMYVFFLVGLVLLLLSLTPLIDLFDSSVSQIIKNTLSGLSLSMIAGAIVSYSIDLPSSLKSFDDYFIDSLTSNNFLNQLDSNRLSTLRHDVTNQLHKITTPNLSEGIIDLDEKIVNLINEPYYSFYSQNVDVDLSSDKKYFIKKNYVHYKLINPFGKNKSYTEKIKLTRLLSSIESIDNDKLISFSKIYFKVDGFKSYDYSKTHDFSISENDYRDDYYNLKFEIKDKSSNKFYEIEFYQNVEVILKYEVKTPVDDICFTKRLQHPTKDFKLDFTLGTDDYKPQGQIFGTEIGKSTTVINQHNKRYLSLESKDWMLPNNGAFVVLVKD